MGIQWLPFIALPFLLITLYIKLNFGLWPIAFYKAVKDNKEAAEDNKKEASVITKLIAILYRIFKWPVLIVIAPLWLPTTAILLAHIKVDGWIRGKLPAVRFGLNCIAFLSTAWYAIVVHKSLLIQCIVLERITNIFASGTELNEFFYFQIIDLRESSSADVWGYIDWPRTHCRLLDTDINGGIKGYGNKSRTLRPA